MQHSTLDFPETPLTFAIVIGMQHDSHILDEHDNAQDPEDE